MNKQREGETEICSLKWDKMNKQPDKIINDGGRGRHGRPRTIKQLLVDFPKR